MEFKHSTLIDPSTYETQELCNGVQLRYNNDSAAETRGAIRAQRDWAKLVGPIPPTHNGVLGDRFHWVSLAFPETLPGRIEVMAYAFEFSVFYDDGFMEHMDQDLDNADRLRIIDDFLGRGDTSRSGSDLTGQSTVAGLKMQGLRKIKNQILAELIAIDPTRAAIMMKSWEEWISVQASNPPRVFTGLDDYLDWRVSNIGEKIIFGTLIFTMSLTLPEHEISLCMRLGRPVFFVIALTNDLYSWEKEHRQFALTGLARQGVVQIPNAIWVLMNAHSITEDEAKVRGKHLIQEHLKEAIWIVDVTKDDVRLSRDLRIYLEALLYVHSGSLVWSLTSPRYNAERTYEPHVLALLEEVKAGSHASSPTV